MRKRLAKAIASSRLFALGADYFSEREHKIGSLWGGWLTGSDSEREDGRTDGRVDESGWMGWMG